MMIHTSYLYCYALMDIQKGMMRGTFYIVFHPCNVLLHPKVLEGICWEKWAEWVGGVEKYFEEKKWPFSKAGTSAKAMVIGLGALNVFGLLVLDTMFKTTTVAPNGFISFVAKIFPLLQVYSTSFFAMPLFRWFLLWKRNADIEKQNFGRKRAKLLELPDSSLRCKLSSARDMACRTVIGSNMIAYSTEKDVSDQDFAAKEWDQRFKEFERSD